jgi:hypothetical protein
MTLPSISAPPALAPDVLTGIDDLIRGDFESFRNACFNWLLISTGVVVLGLLFELPEIWLESINAVSVLRHSPERHIPAWIKLVVSVGWLLIVVGVAGEFVADSFVSKADGFPQKFDEILLADAQKKAGAASERAARAFERAAQTEKEAAEDLKTTNIARQKAEEARQKSEGFQAQIEKDEIEAARLRKDAEDERLARVKIEAAVGWRSLSDQQERDIGAALASFSPKAGASIWYNGSSTEAEMFAGDIAEALRFGHITTTAPGGIMEMRQGGKWNGEIRSTDTGVLLQSTKVPAAIEFAEAVIKELTSRGFDARRQTDPPFEDKPEPVIWVTVQPRPRGPQGEYKLQAEREAKAK